MRIRRKKHLDERLNNVKEYLIVADRDIVNVKEAIKDKRYLDFNALYGNNNPVALEIGCGKGKFSIEMAKKYKDKNFLAVELLENIVVMACENAKNQQLKNIMFFNSGAEYLPRYLKDNSISDIYLNFSPPYPGESYENRRLTSDRYVSSYKSLLVNGGSVFQKTDDKDLYKYSFNKFVEYGFSVTDITERINNNSIDNIETEYESKFRSLGQPIYGLIAKKI